MFRSFTGVVGGEPLAQAIGLNPHDRIRILIEGWAAMEDLDAHRVFLDLARLAGK